MLVSRGGLKPRLSFQTNWSQQPFIVPLDSIICSSDTPGNNFLFIKQMLLSKEPG